VWTKDFKKFPDEVDDVDEDDVEMTGEGSGKVSRVDEDQFETEIRVANETSCESAVVNHFVIKAFCTLRNNNWIRLTILLLKHFALCGTDPVIVPRGEREDLYMSVGVMSSPRTKVLSLSK
jgi:hypothetical protein